MRALVDCNHGFETAYGADRFTASLAHAYSDFFERQVYVFPVPTGTAGNGLALGAVTPPYGTIFCHERAHIVTTEAGAPEFYSGGGRLTLLSGEHNKISLASFQNALREHGIGNVHHMAVSALSLSQATEAGVIYELDELQALSEMAHKAGMKVHLDGARLSNAMVRLGVSPAEITWKVGVDVLTFGTTKNGTMNAEAVITFDPEIAKVVGIMHKRAGHLCSKMRYMSAQLVSYLERDLWRHNALRANQNAKLVVDALELNSGAKILHPVHINEVFVVLPPQLVRALAHEGFNLRPWNFDCDGQAYRMVMSYYDSSDQIQRFEYVLRHPQPHANATQPKPFS